MKPKIGLRGFGLCAVLVLLGLAQGCGSQGTSVAVISPDSQVRRLSPAVFAGDSQPLPELTHNNYVSLSAGGMVTTSALGEAEVKIQNCLTMYVFQKGTLQRSTCRRSEAISGLAACSSGGMTGVLNNCTSQIDIQTPSSSTTTKGTWFSVIYLPEDQLSIVQVYDGEVNVRAVIDPGTDEWAADSQQLAGPGLWFTAPGQEPPVINGIAGRQPLPIDAWQMLRPALIERYPDLDLWMDAAMRRAKAENLVFPEVLVAKSGTIAIRYIGQLWADDRIQRAMITGVDWKDIVHKNWPDFEIRPNLQLLDTFIDDARNADFNRDEALRLMTEADFWQRAPVIIIAANEEDKAAVQFAYDLQVSLADLDVQTELRFVSPAQFDEMQTIDPNVDSPFILVSTSGEAFGRN